MDSNRYDPKADPYYTPNLRKALLSELFDPRDATFAISHIICFGYGTSGCGWLLQIGTHLIDLHNPHIVWMHYMAYTCEFVYPSEQIVNSERNRTAIVDAILNCVVNRITGNMKSMITRVYESVGMDPGIRGSIEGYILSGTGAKFCRHTNVATFKNHTELDEWTINVLPNMKPQLNQNERDLLKGFHEAFMRNGDWGLRYKKSMHKYRCMDPAPPSTCVIDRNNPVNTEHNRARRLVAEAGIVRPHTIGFTKYGFNILVLEHDGVRGMAQLWALHQIELMTQRYSRELFSIICGSGTGAIAAIALVKYQMSALQLIEYYYARGYHASREGKFLFNSVEDYWSLTPDRALNSFGPDYAKAIAFFQGGSFTDANTFMRMNIFIDNCVGGLGIFPSDNPLKPVPELHKIVRTKYPTADMIVVLDVAQNGQNPATSNSYIHIVNDREESDLYEEAFFPVYNRCDAAEIKFALNWLRRDRGARKLLPVYPMLIKRVGFDFLTPPPYDMNFSSYMARIFQALKINEQYIYQSNILKLDKYTYETAGTIVVPDNIELSKAQILNLKLVFKLIKIYHELVEIADKEHENAVYEIGIKQLESYPEYIEFHSNDIYRNYRN